MIDAAHWTRSERRVRLESLYCTIPCTSETRNRFLQRARLGFPSVRLHSEHREPPDRWAVGVGGLRGVERLQPSRSVYRSEWSTRPTRSRWNLPPSRCAIRISNRGGLPPVSTATRGIRGGASGDAPQRRVPPTSSADGRPSRMENSAAPHSCRSPRDSGCAGRHSGSRS